ncbi:Z1 domain-containing protein [Kribbella sp. NPDC056345]|uniref:Z1 domain-containing protein n=1 Tax=Kribbella sp. NPDC056345 TaxID=3345789 RepID=UPI0035D66686
MTDPGLYPVFAHWARLHGIEAAVDRFRLSLPAQVDDFREQFERDRARVEAGGPPVIAAGQDPWYSGASETDIFWPALEGEFRRQEWPKDRLESVDRASSTVVAHTPRPSRPNWDAKGLVVGYVQSGKTTNFTGVIAKLADVDYRMIIVLSGIHNGLRRQTQVRLDELLKDLNKDKWVTMTQESTDFVAPPQRASALLSSNKPILIVAKKNTAVLKRIVRWLDTPDGRDALQTARVLVIDDEADQASVATAQINPLIRRLLKLMPRCTYVGYTATPFANVFIAPNQDDLYPKSFILNLPRPEGYFGPEMIFGRDVVEGELEGAASDGYDMVRLVPERDMSALRPVGRASASDFEPEMTDSLVDAVRWFWLATAARRARGDDGHSTMLIHTSVKIDVHEAFKSPLQGLRAAALRELARGDADDLEKWRMRWVEESSKVPAEEWDRKSLTFDEVLLHLQSVIDATKVILDNYRSQDRLDYSKGPVVAIAVGGNTLSRGLTLEGLVVSLFVRGATAYDTLLQMGRWFGYRTGYEELPRIWMTSSLAAAFRHLATVEHEMRDDIDRYQRQNLTPLQVAVRIRTHPSLRITAKMGAAQPAEVSYAGSRLQTRYFFTRDGDWLEKNLEATRALVQESLRHGRRGDKGTAVVLRDVPAGVVKDFLSTYRVHPDSPDMDPSLLLKYIDKQLEADPPSLSRWSVCIVPGGGTPVELGGVVVGSVLRSRLDDGDETRADIKTLMSKQDRVLDLDISTTDAQAMSEERLKDLRDLDQHHKDRGLIVVYPIDPASKPTAPSKARAAGSKERLELDALRTVVGIGLVFPGQAAKKNSVVATHLAVDLTDVEQEDLEDAIETDTELAE